MGNKSSVPFAGLLVLVAMVATIGLPLFGVGSLHASDTLQTLDPWAQSATPGFRPANGTVSDTVDAIAPVRISVAERARHGDLALWSTTQGGGAPALGVPNTAMFSPLSLPWWILPGHAAPALAKFLQMLVAAVGLWLCARRLGASRNGAAIGALAFVNAGHMVVWTSWAQSNVAALAPWLLWSVERALTEDSRGEWWPVPLIGASMWLEGFPALTLWAHVLVGTWVLARLASRPRPGRVALSVAAPAHLTGAAGSASRVSEARRERRRTLVTAIVAMAVGLAIAAVQLVPFMFRVGELSLGEARAGKAAEALPWEAAGTILFPHLFGGVGPGVWFGPRNEVELQAFLGMTGFVLVAAAWTWRRRLQVVTPWWSWSTWSLGVVAAMIWFGPMNTVLQAIPVVGGNQTGRLRGLIAMLFALLVAFGFDAISSIGRTEETSTEPPASRVSARLLVFGRIVVVGLLASVPMLLRARSLADARGRADVVASAVLWPTVVLLVAILLLVTVVRTTGRLRSVALVCLPLLLAVEVVGYARSFLPVTATEDFYPRTAAHDIVAELIGPNRFAVGDKALYPGTTTIYGLRSLTAHAAMPAGWRDLLEEADPNVFDRSATFPILSPTADVAGSAALDLMGVTHFVTEEAAPTFGNRDRAQPLAQPLAEGAPINGIDIDRAVLVTLADHDPPVALAARILAEDGRTVLASGERLLDPREVTDWLSLAMVAPPGQPAPTGGRLEVFLRLDPQEPGLPVPLDPTLPVRAVRVAADGLFVVAIPDVVIYARPNAWSRIRAEDADGGLATEVMVDVTADLDDETLVTVTAPRQPVVLVLADARSGGHRATVDDIEVPVTTVHGAFVGVEVPLGTHDVRIWFEPEGIRFGAALTVLGLLAVWAAARSTLAARPRRDRT